MFKKNNYTQNGVSNELKELKSDVAELSQLLQRAVRQSMKEFISTEVNTILAKIESLCETVSEQTSIKPKWTDVVTGRHMRAANDRRENIYRIPIINNRYELPCNSEVCETLVFNSAKNHEVRKHHKKQTSKKKKHKILIIRDSHGRECASKLMYNLDSDFEVQGIIKQVLI
jgi:hypothetical protein